MLIARSIEQIDVSFSCVCPVIDHEFRHNIVKVAVDPRGPRSAFQIFCSRSLHQYRLNYKFHVSVRLLTMKISQ